MTNLGLRDRQRLQTHAALQNAAFDLVEARGLAGVTVAQIAEAAGTSERTFFTHFRTKEEALAPRLPPLRPEAIDAFVSAEEPDLLTALATLVITQHLDKQQGSERPTPERVMRVVMANPELIPQFLAMFDGFKAELAELVARRLRKPATDLQCRTAAIVAMSGLRLAAESWQLTRSGKAGKPISSAHISVAFDGIRALISP